MSRSAETVLSEESVFGRQMWIIFAIIKATGPCSRILIICRAFVTAAIAGKHMRNCSKNDARIYHDKAKNAGTLRHVHDMYTRIRDSLQIPPGSKKFRAIAEIPPAYLHAKISPHGQNGGGGAK